MKRFAFVLCCIILGGAIYMATRESRGSLVDNQSKTDTREQNQDSPDRVAITSRSIFVPYWNIPRTGATYEYDTLMYFGVTPDTKGVLKKDTGYSNIQRFVSQSSAKQQRLFTLRMLDTQTNIAILDDESAQDSVISETMSLVRQHNFDGIVLDLEMSVIPFSDVQQNISAFTQKVSDTVRKEKKEVVIALYGDTFYRGRPYDVKKLGAMSDKVLIMAYDYHKSRGEPGANFPFEREGEYDFKRMIRDFSQEVPPEKLIVAFGMYGYDWTLGDQGLPLKQAKAIPLWEIEKGYTHCDHRESSSLIQGSKENRVSADSCILHTDTNTKEKKITYTDSEGYSHELWYEDRESVEVKKKYLEEQGIGSIGYWVWGYF